MSKVIIYTSTFCGYCTAAKSLLSSKGISFEEINLSATPELRHELVAKWNWRTLPLILVNEELVGGFRELAILENQNKLDALLSTDQ